MNKRLMGLTCFILLVFPLIVFGTVLRTYDLDSTGYEVDEVSNFNVSYFIQQIRVPAVRPESGASIQPYLFHPFFGYYLMAGWFQLVGTGIFQARMLSACISIVVLLMLYMFLSKTVGKGTALLAVFFISLDTWIVLINRMNYLENLQLVLIVIGIWAFWKASSTSRFRWYTMAGLMLGLAIIFKHIGVFLVVMVLANWILLVRQRRRLIDLVGHLITLNMIVWMVFGYVLWMTSLYGPIYADQQMVQFSRLFGEVESRGMNFGPIQAAQIIFERYWIFITTVLALLIGWPLIVWDYGRAFLFKFKVGETVLLSWAISGLIFAVLSQLKSPHYLILWLIPLYAYIAYKGVNWAKGKRLFAIPVLLLLFLFANLFSWNYRFVEVNGDALRYSANFINLVIPTSAVIATEQYEGMLIKQPYVRIDTLTTAQKLEKVDFLAIYQSSTATLQDLPPVVQNAAKTCQFIARFEGFKDEIVLCKTVKASR